MKSTRAKIVLFHAGILAVFTTLPLRAGADTLARFHCQPGAAEQDMCEELNMESPLFYKTNSDGFIAVGLVLPDPRVRGYGYDRFIFGFQWTVEQGTKIRIALYRKVNGVLESPPIFTKAYSVYPEECQLGICKVQSAWGNPSELFGWLAGASGSETREYAAEVVVTTFHVPTHMNDIYSQQESFRVTANFTDADGCAIVSPRPLGGRNLLALLPFLALLVLRWKRARGLTVWCGVLSLCTVTGRAGASGLPRFYEGILEKSDPPARAQRDVPTARPPLAGGFDLPEGGIAARGQRDPETGDCRYDGVTFVVDRDTGVPAVRLLQNDPEESGQCELRVSYQSPLDRGDDANLATRHSETMPISRERFEDLKRDAALLDRFLAARGQEGRKPPGRPDIPDGSGATAGECVIRAMGRMTQYNSLGPNVGVPGFEPLHRFPMLDDLYLTTTVIDTGNGFGLSDLIGPDAFPYGLGLLGYQTLPHVENSVHNTRTPDLWEARATQWFRLGPNIVAGSFFNPSVGYHHRYQVAVIHQPRGRVSLIFSWSGSIPTRWPILPEVYAGFRWTYFNCPTSWMETNTAPRPF